MSENLTEKVVVLLRPSMKAKLERLLKKSDEHVSLAALVRKALADMLADRERASR